MLDIFATRLIKWLIVFAAISIGVHAYGLTTGKTELVSPISNSIDNVQETPSHACDRIDWRQTDRDGSPLIPFDANEDGYIDCQSDIELGS
jgi:hypothetical protein